MEANHEISAYSLAGSVEFLVVVFVFAASRRLFTKGRRANAAAGKARKLRRVTGCECKDANPLGAKRKCIAQRGR